MSLRSHEAIVKSIETDGFSGAMPDGTGFRAPHHAPAGHDQKASIPIATPLQRLVRDALEAERNLTGDDYRRLDDDEIDRREDACLTTRVALREYLASQGLTIDEINGIGEVL